MIFFWPSKLLKTWQLYSHLALSFLLQKMPPGVPLEQFVDPVQQLQHHEEAHAGQLGQQQQQQQEEEESETLQPVRFDKLQCTANPRSSCDVQNQEWTYQEDATKASSRNCLAFF